MKVTQVNSPHAIQQTNTDHQKVAATKERAIAKLLGTQAPAANSQAPTPINPSQVAPEELSALTPGVPTPNIQKPNTEAPTTATPDATAQPAPQPDAQLQALVRREKALRLSTQKAQEALKTQQAQIDKQKADLDARQKDMEQGYIPKTRIKQDPLTVLAESDVTYDQITQHQLEAQNVNPQVKSYLTKLESTIEQLKSKLDSVTQQQESSQEESRQAALKQISRDATSLVTKDTTNNYELIRHYGKAGIQEVVKLIETEFNETGEQMDIDEACRLVESEYETRINKLTSLKKVQSKLQPQNGERTATTQPQVPNQQTPQMKTLTNTVGSTRQLSAKERAVLAFEGKLKS